MNNTHRCLPTNQPHSLTKLRNPIEQRFQLSQYELFRDAKAERKYHNDSLRDAAKLLSLNGMETLNTPIVRNEFSVKKVKNRTPGYMPFVIEPKNNKKNIKSKNFNGFKPVTTNLLELASLSEASEDARESKIVTRNSSCVHDNSISDRNIVMWASEAGCSSHLQGMKHSYDRYLEKLAQKKEIYLIPEGVYADPHDYSEFYAVEKVDIDLLQYNKEMSRTHQICEVVHDEDSIDLVEYQNLPIEYSDKLAEIADSNLEESLKNLEIAHKIAQKTESPKVMSPYNRSRFNSKDVSRASHHSKKSNSKRNKSIGSSKPSKNSKIKTSQFGQIVEVDSQKVIFDNDMSIQDKVISNSGGTSAQQSKALSSLGMIQEKKFDSVDGKKLDDPDVNLSGISNDMSLSVMITSQPGSDPNRIITHQDLPLNISPAQKLLRKTTTTTEFNIKKGLIRADTGGDHFLKKFGSVALEEDGEEEDDIQDIYGSSSRRQRENIIPFHTFNFKPQIIQIGKDGLPSFSNS